MADVRRPISYYSNSRRPRPSSVVQRGESSVSTKRARSSASPQRRPLPRRTARSVFSDDDDDDFIINDGSHRWDNDDDREEDEQQRRNQDEPGSSRDDDGFSGGSDEDDVMEEEAGGGVEEEQPAGEEEESDDDDRPISMSRARTLVHRVSTSTTPASMPAAAPARPEPSPPSSSSSSSSNSSSVIRNVTVENSSAFDCSICYLPLKTPIFQCTVGHVVCSPCHDKLWQATSCHVCRVPIPDGYFRCNVMEQVVDSIRVPCPHAAHGCAAMPAYHEREDHARTCAHKPCHCPVDGCGFAGPVQTTLQEHFAAVHGWPCTARSTRARDLDVRLRKGFNVVNATGEDEHEHYMLVLKVEQQSPVCNAITAFCIHPSHTGIVLVGLSYYWRWRRDSGLFISKCMQSSQLDVVCTDLSNGVPDPSSCYPLLVSRWSATPGGDDGDDISVTINYIRRDIGSMFSVWST